MLAADMFPGVVIVGAPIARKLVLYSKLYRYGELSQDASLLTMSCNSQRNVSNSMGSPWHGYTSAP